MAPVDVDKIRQHIEIDAEEVFEIADRHLGDSDTIISALTACYFEPDRDKDPDRSEG